MTEIDERRFHERHQHFLKEVLARAQDGKKPSLEDVHTTYCCSLHGCKYGKEDLCPVARREHAQVYPCERCDFEASELAFSEPEAEAYSRTVVVMDGDRDSNDPPPRVFLRYQGEDGPHAIPLAPCATAVEAKAQFADLAWAVKCAYLAGVVRA